MIVEVATQAELDELGPDVIAIVRSGRFVVRGDREVWAYDSAKVWAYDSTEVWARGSAKVWAYNSAEVWAYDSAEVWTYDSTEVWARESAKVWAYDSAKVEAYDSAKVWAWESAKVVAYDAAEVAANDDAIVYMMNMPEDWCKFHDIPIVDGKCILFKAVGDDWRGTHRVDNITYRPGDTPVAHDWNDRQECGHGLHLSITPKMARDYNLNATHYVACEVDVASMVTLGDKVKVPTLRCLYEVTMEGDEL